jgi:hypothetical protein
MRPMSSLRDLDLAPVGTLHSELNQIGVRPVGGRPRCLPYNRASAIQLPVASKVFGSNATSRGLFD